MTCHDMTGGDGELLQPVKCIREEYRPGDT